MDYLFLTTKQKKKQYLLGASAVLLTGGTCYALSDFISYRVVAFILLLVVSLLAVTFDILPVLLAAALSALIWDFFFIPPRYALHVDTTEDLILLVMYFVIALISGVLTYKVRQAEKRARLKEERANSVKLYNTILDSLSHELRTPIAAIIGATDNLQANANLTAGDKAQLIGVISKASLRLNQQVENLLNISRLESGHIKPKDDWCDVVELVYGVVKKVEENHPDRKIDVSINQAMPLCKTDKGMLDQILYNLLINAAIHTQRHASISIMATCHADLLQFIIEDGGQGFRDVDIKDVFHKFSRDRNPKTGGSGLGLSIVKGFTEALRGTVELQRRSYAGARFTLSFPVKTSYMNVGHDET